MTACMVLRGRESSRKALCAHINFHTLSVTATKRGGSRMKPISAIEPRKARLVPVIVAVFALSTLLPLASAGSAAVPEEKPTERHQAISLTEALLRPLERNLDITFTLKPHDFLFPKTNFDKSR